ncbi:hypothetical protein N665_1099s0006 [Sinapis alba]|nr:hypothetical protein N665_1099s0006 [Sinapis alba]
MLEAPVLTFPDFSRQFVVETDASEFSVGAILMQGKRPIAYFSHGLSVREQLKPIYERKLMAVVMAIRAHFKYNIVCFDVTNITTTERVISKIAEDKNLQETIRLIKVGNIVTVAILGPKDIKTHSVVVSLEWIFRYVQQPVAACQVCQTHKYSTLSPAGLLQPLPIPTMIWEDLSIDFIERMPMSNGSNVIFVIVDRLSKYGHFLILKHPFQASDVDNVS